MVIIMSNRFNLDITVSNNEKNIMKMAFYQTLEDHIWFCDHE